MVVCLFVCLHNCLPCLLACLLFHDSYCHLQLLHNPLRELHMIPLYGWSGSPVLKCICHVFLRLVLSRRSSFHTHPCSSAVQKFCAFTHAQPGRSFEYGWDITTNQDTLTPQVNLLTPSPAQKGNRVSRIPHADWPITPLVNGASCVTQSPFFARLWCSLCCFYWPVQTFSLGPTNCSLSSKDVSRSGLSLEAEGMKRRSE